MTFFLNIPQVEQGIQAAKNAMGTLDESQSEASRQRLVAMLDDMLTFAEANVQSMLDLMGYSSMEELNTALNNYNNLNLSLQRLLPSFSAPRLSEILARAGIGTTGDQVDYNILASALEDSIRQNFQLDDAFNNTQIGEQILEQLSNSANITGIAYDMAMRLFSGSSNASLILDLMSGQVSMRGKILGDIQRTAKENNIEASSIPHTINPFIKYIEAVLQEVVNQKLELFTDRESNTLLMDTFARTANNLKISKDLLTKRIKRGGIKAKAKIRVEGRVNNDTISLDTYMDQLVVDVDRDIFNLDLRRKDQSIENYVNSICNSNPRIKAQITQNIKVFYWQQIMQNLPAGINQSIISKESFDEIIDGMVSESDGNIGWFFSQGTTKAGGAGMFGEIAGMIYMAVLCPKLKDNARLIWAGGVTGDAKPPADIILGTALKQYGIQIKNYTSGSTLSHDYSLKIKNILDEAANNNNDNKLDLMTLQATSELGITEAEIEAVQNIIIANSFNIPYVKKGNLYVAGPNSEFSGTRSALDAVFKQATKYMAVISVIMHRLQYAEEITRKVSATKEELQLQNTLWIINGAMFVSSVQILNELKQYVLNEIDRFFNVTTSIKIKGDNLPEGMEKGSFTIVEYYNYSAKGLGKTALSHVSARIGTNYRMSAFNP